MIFPIFEFHISFSARKKYQFTDSIFAFTGNVVFANFQAAKQLAHQMNTHRDVQHFPDKTIRAGQLYAMGLIDEIFHVVVALYREQKNANVMKEALDFLEQSLGKKVLDQTLTAFLTEFPPMAVYQAKKNVSEYLVGKTQGFSHREIALEEMLLLWLANFNPAFRPFQELFDAENLERTTEYQKIISLLHAFFETQPHFGPENQNLVDMLRSPASVVPYSLSGQLEYIRTRWGHLLGKFLYRIFGGLDFLKEEEMPFWAGMGPGESQVPEYADLEKEVERYTPDREWMPRVVLLAKNVYVWLDQLSKKYNRSIEHLDQIPDQELDTLQRWGFTGLWLIGIWQRSKASQKIKQYCGNPEALGSAYALYDYRIAEALGGEPAFENFRTRAWQRGIRIGTDMVPNHMAIDSQWVIEHPDWFIGLDHSPFPSYTFHGPNLSEDPRVALFIEDHYYDRTDAAVVFKRVDTYTGEVRYIYHGNDGTHMPWNDTAQLNYLRSDIREAMIQTIVSVARRFSIIRFDAAMTLTQFHYQRLWFPEPGKGGAISSRAEHGLSKEEFTRLMPQEFWREVVDRINREVPDTLLLAEAFWLLEGYFVRTLGMHRVYNSAFMHMLRDEHNAKYRSLIKETLVFDPEILKRYVNFMNNPDEQTAVDQFGKEGKYFGICTLMVTLPGLPLFGHGQVEGFREKYGMEYRKAYWDEFPDTHLIERHEREIFPLLHQRALFSDVHHFRFYDFFHEDGSVDENMFAYSNRLGEERALVVYHNRFAETRGWIRTSVPYRKKNSNMLFQETLGHALGLSLDGYVIFRDHVSGLEYIRSCKELFEQGLYLELGAYQVHVFLNFREVKESAEFPYGKLVSVLKGRGVERIDSALERLKREPLQKAFFQWISAFPKQKQNTHFSQLDFQNVEKKALSFFTAFMEITINVFSPQELTQETRRKAEAFFTPSFPGEKVKDFFDNNPNRCRIMLSWILFSPLWEKGFSSSLEKHRFSLRSFLLESYQSLGMDLAEAQKSTLVLQWLLRHSKWYETETVEAFFENFLGDESVREFLQVHRDQEILWFHKESFEEMLEWLYVIGILGVLFEFSDEKTRVRQIQRINRILRTLEKTGHKSGYQFEKWREEIFKLK